MFSVRIDFLTGAYSATDFQDRSATEWPPHPGRVFSALVAAWGQSGESESGAAALEWLETQGSPDIWADPVERVSTRAPVTHYVPDADPNVVDDYATQYQRLREHAEAVANVHSADTPLSVKRSETALEKELHRTREYSKKAGSKASAPMTALEVLPSNRGKQARQFPTAIPEHPITHLVWPGSEPPIEVASALDELATSVGRLGHSSTFVAITTTSTDLPPDEVANLANYRPSQQGEHSIRVVAPGLFKALRDDYAWHEGRRPRIMENISARYTVALPSAANPGNGHPLAQRQADRCPTTWQVVTIRETKVTTDTGTPVHTPVSFPLHHALPITRAIRGALQKYASEPSREILSGHSLWDDHGTKNNHVSVFPLPNSGAIHSDGYVQNFAIAIPTNATAEDRRYVIDALQSWRRDNGKLRPSRLGGDFVIELPADPYPTITSRPSYWVRPAEQWCSVTPVALNRWPKHLSSTDRGKREHDEKSVKEFIAAACEDSGLPTPIRVEFGNAPFVKGTDNASRFVPYVAGTSKTRRFLLHTRLTFGAKIDGPVLIGAGRFLGYGLCVPIAPARDSASGGRHV